MQDLETQVELPHSAEEVLPCNSVQQPACKGIMGGGE